MSAYRLFGAPVTAEAALAQMDLPVHETCGQSRLRVSGTVHQARESLGHRLRDLRKDAGLTGRQLAEAAGWYPSKVSKIEYGRQTPSSGRSRTMLPLGSPRGWSVRTAVMAGQLDRVLTIMGIPRVHLGIVPARHRYTVPTHGLCMLDDRAVLVETISAELTVTQPREIALHSRAFDALTKAAKYGKAAKTIITDALATYR